MWCIPGELDAEYIERMEDILDLLERPLNSREPVVCLDERPVQLHDEVRTPRPAKPGQISRRDSEYRRRGTANVFAVVAPKEGIHLTKATRNRKGMEFARMLQVISRKYPVARRIHLIVDNLNTHCLKSLITVYGELKGRRLWKRFSVHYTPKHGSWLNPAEIEISLLSRECLGSVRIPEFDALRRRVSKWNARSNRCKRRIYWTFTSSDAREKFHYRRKGVKFSLARH